MKRTWPEVVDYVFDRAEKKAGERKQAAEKGATKDQTDHCE